jgi:formate--tetrahydrofolate ligase
MSFPSDLEIARAVTPRPIGDVAADLGLRPAELEMYGPTKAKVTLAGVERVERERPRGKYVVVTAITPTPLGEGKTTTTVGLAQGLNRIGRKASVAIRQPSLGPVFGIKGGADPSFFVHCHTRSSALSWDRCADLAPTPARASASAARTPRAPGVCCA